MLDVKDTRNNITFTNVYKILYSEKQRKTLQYIRHFLGIPLTTDL